MQRQRKNEQKIIPATQVGREKLLEQCPRLIVNVAARCRVSASTVSRVYHGIAWKRATAQRVRRALENEILRRRAKLVSETEDRATRQGDQEAAQAAVFLPLSVFQETLGGAGRKDSEA